MRRRQKYTRRTLSKESECPLPPPLPRGLQNQDKTNLAEIGAICGYSLLTRYNLDKPK